MSKLIKIVGFSDHKIPYDEVSSMVVEIDGEYHLLSSPYIIKVGGKWRKTSDVDIVLCFDQTKVLRQDAIKLVGGSIASPSHLKRGVVQRLTDGSYEFSSKVISIKSGVYSLNDKRIVQSDMGYNLKENCVKASKFSKHSYLSKETAVQCSFSKVFFGRDEVLTYVEFGGSRNKFVSSRFAPKLNLKTEIIRYYMDGSSEILESRIVNDPKHLLIFIPELNSYTSKTNLESVLRTVTSFNNTGETSDYIRSASRNYGAFGNMPDKLNPPHPKIGLRVIRGNIEGGRVYSSPNKLESRFCFSESLVKTGGIGYTFGLEHETSVGILPLPVCNSYGLSRIGDGSTRFNHLSQVVHYEYVTSPMHGSDGVNKIKGYMPYLEKHTLFNELCSTHIHIGGKKVGVQTTDTPSFNRKFSALAIRLGCLIENSIAKYVPEYRNPKSNSHCRSLTGFSNDGYSVEDFSKYPINNKKDYNKIVARFVFGSDNLDSSNNSNSSLRKWNNQQRKHWMNLVNCNSRNGANRHNTFETIEFRLFPATRNADVAHMYLLMCLAIVWFVENKEKDIKSASSITIEQVLEAAYKGKKIYSFITDMLPKMKYK